MEVFDDTFIPPGLGEMRFAARHCPHCVWPYLRPVHSLDESHWLCESCGHCWYIEHGRLRPSISTARGVRSGRAESLAPTAPIPSEVL